MSGLVLRDVHVPPAPPLWPPAPGWWIVAGVLAALALAWLVVRHGRSRRRQRALAWFDAEVANATSPAQRLAIASELLRRAARRVRRDADRLDGEDWLAFLDTGDGAFLRGPGRLLLDGPFRPDVHAAQADAALALARARFASLQGAR